MARRKRLLAGFWIGLALFSPALPLILFFSGNWYSILHSYSMGMVFGIFAYSYFLITLMLSARLRFLDRLFGHDRVLVFHRYLAITAFCFAGAHLAFKAIYSLEISGQKLLGVVGFLLFCGALPVASAAMAQGYLHRFASVRSFKTLLMRRWKLDYSLLKFMHNSTVVASILVAIHVFLASSTQENSLRSWFMSAWAGLALLLYAWHKGVRPLLNLRKAHTVDRITPLSPNIVELELKPPGRKQLPHRAGQFGYIRILDKACGIEEHPFTISSPPDAGTVTITVKNLGDYTARLTKLSKGSKALVDGPYGVFTPLQDGRPKLFVAGGIGVTPFLSIIAAWDREGFRQKVTLVWSCRELADMVHRELFETCAARHPEFSFIPVITSAEQKTAYAKRIDRTLLESLVIALERNRLEAYVCGPERLRQSVTADLRSCGILGKNIHFENFSQ